jgi:hypothetical protein
MRPGTHDVFDKIVLEGLLVRTACRAGTTSEARPGQGDPRLPDRRAGKLRARELQLQREGKPLDSSSLAILSNF